MTTREQYTFTKPVEPYAENEPRKQHQPEPGLDAKLEPRADVLNVNGDTPTP